MKNVLAALGISLALFIPLLAACSSSDTTTDESAAAPDDNVESSDEEVRAGRKKGCSTVGGRCVGLTPSACRTGHWADASKVSCGRGVGTGCCITCPTLSPPGPGFCPDGKVTPRVGENGCTIGFDCVPNCPLPAPPPPGFCPNGTIVVQTDSRGCPAGRDCVPNPGDTLCYALGGACVGISPGACPSGNWGPPSACGGAVGTGCCLP